MRFSLEHRLEAPLDRVESAVLDPAFQASLTDLPNLSDRVVLSQDDQPDGTIRRVVRYRFGGELPGPVRSAVGSSEITWEEHATWRPSDHTWVFEIRPDVFRSKFSCTGTYRFVAEGPETTVRHVDGDVRVGVPIVGSRVEKAIIDGLVRTMDAEARALARFLAETKGTL